MMNENDIFESQFKDTLEKASYDDTNNQYMTKNQTEVINFDKIKDSFCKSDNLNPKFTAKSNDTLYINNNKYLFIEFKNGNINKKVSYELKLKNYDSTVILSDILNLSLRDFKEKVNYLLVFNEDRVKSLDTDVSSSDTDATAELHNEDSSIPMDRFIKALEVKAHKKIIRFGLEDFKGYINKDVTTIDVKEFEDIISRDTLDYFIQ